MGKNIAENTVTVAEYKSVGVAEGELHHYESESELRLSLKRVASTRRNL